MTNDDEDANGDGHRDTVDNEAVVDEPPHVRHREQAETDKAHNEPWVLGHDRCNADTPLRTVAAVGHRPDWDSEIESRFRHDSQRYTQVLSNGHRAELGLVSS